MEHTQVVICRKFWDQRPTRPHCLLGHGNHLDNCSSLAYKAIHWNIILDVVYKPDGGTKFFLGHLLLGKGGATGGVG
eukprot:15347537-Ditylum_brightwellii.AAC.1